MKELKFLQCKNRSRDQQQVGAGDAPSESLITPMNSQSNENIIFIRFVSYVTIRKKKREINKNQRRFVPR